VSPVELTDRRGGGGGGRVAKSYVREKAWPCINNSRHSDGIIQIFVQCCGSGMFIPDSGSECFPSRILYPNIFHPGSASNNISILTQKIGFSASKICAGLFIPNPDPIFLHVSEPGSGGQKGTRSRIRPHNTVFVVKLTCVLICLIYFVDRTIVLYNPDAVILCVAGRAY